MSLYNEKVGGLILWLGSYVLPRAPVCPVSLLRRPADATKN